MPRARELGIEIGQLPPGPLNAITDVAGVAVGHTTLISGDDVRTGVTVIQPRAEDPAQQPAMAGAHVLNGNGEMTGLHWLRESGLLTTPIGLTTTHSVGVVHAALVAASLRNAAPGSYGWSLPVVAETYDGWLNDAAGEHVRREHVDAALAAAANGPVAEGNVGGGTGMMAFGFKSGIGTASRVVDAGGPRTVGVLVQSNFGERSRLSVGGVPVGREIPVSEIPAREVAAPSDAGSIIGIIATDAPLLPHQCERLAHRAALGMARTGGAGGHSSGDIFLAFATGNRDLGPAEGGDAPLRTLQALNDDLLTSLYWATIEATEEAILNALLAAKTMTGRDGHTAHALPHDRLLEVMARYGRIGSR